MATKESKTAKYISRFAKLSIAVKSARYQTVNDEKVLVPGQRINFDGGYYETDDAGVIAALEARADFGTAFVRIPDNKTVDDMRESMRANDEKDKIIAAQKAEIERLKGKVGDDEEGGNASAPAVSERMSRDDLETAAQEAGVAQSDIDNAANKAALVELINAKRSEGGTASFEE